MTSSFTLALAQINPVVGDMSGNVRLMIDAAKEAAGQGADLVLYPEMAVTGYPPEDLVLIPAFRERAMAEAFSKLILWMEADYGWSRWDAYDLLTHVAQISIGYYGSGTVGVKIARHYAERSRT